MHPANEIRRYNVTTFLIGWVHALANPCYLLFSIVHVGELKTQLRPDVMASRRLHIMEWTVKW